MKIHIPNSAFLGNIDAFLNSFDPTNPDDLYITTNDRWISVHPMVLSMIASLGIGLEPKNIHFDNVTAKSGHYLKRMGLFDILNVESPMEVQEHEAAGRFIPLTIVKTSDELARFISEINPLLHLPSLPSESICYIVSELVRNVLEHALSRDGAIVSAQYFKKTNVVRIGIADTGVGLWRTINASHSVRTDLDAMKLALTPGITGTTSKEGGTETNAGAGLFFVKSIAKINNNFFAIYSGNSLYKLLKPSRSSKRLVLYGDPNLDRHSEREDLPIWQGTVVGIDLSLDATSELTELLEAIGETYSSTIEERKKRNFKKPRFV